jgi:hypothetical protein
MCVHVTDDLAAALGQAGRDRNALHARLQTSDEYAISN